MTDIFISYSHQDEKWKDALQKQLRVLQLHADFTVWDDRQIDQQARYGVAQVGKYPAN